MEFNPAVLIPVYNHEEAVGITVVNVLRYGCPVLLVDDGSGPACRDLLIELSQKHSDHVKLLRLECNGGKGAAVKAGLKALLADGYNHAIQIDADGQHDLSDLPTFLEVGKNNPDSLITGYPTYDQSVPTIRYYSRYLTHIWVWINTLSFEIRDTMCGFRVYPLKDVVQLIEEEKCGNRMDFDPEVIVRWSWRGGSIKNLPTRVNYPLDGISHFDIWRDNLLISLMHSRLFFGMLRRFPKIIWERING
ncbi:glycosyltransferase family 2 protein [Motiliproteus sp. MSK22-1]|uniref:glycosyltransferase family 2 protein n=1 Tax=Motiliproteus sp. MSK22-1 TaxID=1897630 RepID=UPI0018E94688|nr:glycosyltransferase family 2 protein [Motiliproteus sp. MSK22-1]